MDSCNISIIEMSLPASWFSYFHVTKATRIGFSVQLFSKILSTRDKTGSQEITIEMKNSTDDMLTIYMNNENKEEKGKALVEKEFEMPLMEIDTDMLSIPEQEYDVEFAMASSEFAELIQQLRIFGDTLKIECNESYIQTHSVSIDKGGMQGKIDIERLRSFSIVEDETIKMAFSLTHLSNIVAFHKIAQQVEVHMKAESPIMISYPLLNFVTEGCANTYMRFYLAPKIDDSD
jgi:proliferating cell nuclear antigen PCNA